MQNKKTSNTPYSIDKISILEEANVPEQVLKDTSWVMIFSDTDERKSQVFIFNNDEMPEDYQYASFKEWVELSIDDLVMDKNLKMGERFNSDISIDTVTFHTNQEGKEDTDGWSRLDTRSGISCQVLHFYNGGLKEEDIQSKVNICNSSCGNVISDFVDGREYEEELRRERMFRP